MMSLFTQATVTDPPGKHLELTQNLFLSVYDAGPTSNQHSPNVSCSLRYQRSMPNKDDKLVLCWFNTGQTSTTLVQHKDQHWVNISCLLGSKSTLIERAGKRIFTIHRPRAAVSTAAGLGSSEAN